MRYSKFLFMLVISIALAGLISGCEKNSVKTVAEKTPQTDQLTNDNSETATGTGPEVLASNIDTSDWLTYKSDEFELKYPEDWIYEKTQTNFIKFTKNENILYDEQGELYLLGIMVQKFDSVEEKNDYINEWKKSRLNRNETVNEKEINGSKVFQNFGFLGADTLFDRENSIHSISAPLYKEGDMEEVYKKILESFSINK